MKIDIEFARRDDCLDQMVPSDLRLLVSERDQLRAELAALSQAVPDDEELKVLRAFYRCCASIIDQLADSPKSALARLVEAVKDAAPSANKESGDE